MKNSNIKPGYLFSTRYTNYIFFLLFLLYLFDYADRMVVTSMFTTIQKEWGINDTQSGWLVSVIYLAIGLLTFPVSLIIDRWSRTKTIGIMAIVWSIATALVCLYGQLCTAVYGPDTDRVWGSRLCAGRKCHDFSALPD